MRSLRPWRRVFAFCVLAFAVGMIAGAPVRVTAIASAAPPDQDATQPGANRAALVIRYGDGDVQTACVSFAEPVIYGDDVLQLAGVGPDIHNDGRVCSIDGAGCSSSDCWCQCTDFNNCTYWAYYHLVNGAWEYSQLGATISVVNPGAVEGWSWGRGDFVSAVEPPVYTFEQICGAPAADTQTATPTATPTATATTAPVNRPTPPQIAFFQANPTVLTAGACTLLNWSVSGAQEVRVDGVAVPLAGQKQVCPVASSNYSLVATNGAGADSRTVTVQVQTAPPTAPSTATLAPAATRPIVTPTTAPQAGLTTPMGSIPVATPAPIATPAPAELASVPPMPIEAFPAETAAVAAVPAGDQAGDGAAFAQPTRTPFRLVAPATSTPRPRTILGANGRPTPTPILVARVDAARPNAPRDAAPRDRTSANTERGDKRMERSFQAALLPQYAAFLMMVACLAVMGAWVLHRKTRASVGAEAAHPDGTRRSSFRR